MATRNLNNPASPGPHPGEVASKPAKSTPAKVAAKSEVQDVTPETFVTVERNTTAVTEAYESIGRANQKVIDLEADYAKAYSVLDIDRGDPITREKFYAAADQIHGFSQWMNLHEDLDDRERFIQLGTLLVTLGRLGKQLEAARKAEINANNAWETTKLTDSYGPVRFAEIIRDRILAKPDLAALGQITVRPREGWGTDYAGNRRGRVEIEVTNPKVSARIAHAALDAELRDVSNLYDSAGNLSGVGFTGSNEGYVYELSGVINDPVESAKLTAEREANHQKAESARLNAVPMKG
jgi:hypothetical protein